MTTPLSKLAEALRAENTQHLRKARKNEQQELEIERFLDGTIMPAFKAIGEEMAQHGRRAEVTTGDGEARIVIFEGDRQEYSYKVKPTPDQEPHLLQINYQQRKQSRHRPFYIDITMSMTGTRRKLSDITQDEIIEDFQQHFVDGM